MLKSQISVELQESLFEYLHSHTLEEAEAWLATQGVDAGRTALSKFRSWWPVARHLRKAASVANSVKEILEELPQLKLDAQQVSQAMQAVFEAQAMEAQDSKLFVSLRQLRQTDEALKIQKESGKTKAEQGAARIAQKDRDFALQREKFVTESCEKILQAARDPKVREIVESEVPNAEKIRLIREAYFADIDAVEVALPE